jgi:predicted RNase H-like HicB family nuclease
MTHYVALIHKDPKSDYGVSFPDFPGCVSAGGTLEQAIAMAEEALAGHIGILVEDGAPIPEPSAIEAIVSDPENQGAFGVLVPAPEPADKVVRVNVTLPARLLRRIDAATENRSRFLAEAAEKALRERAPSSAA